MNSQNVLCKRHSKDKMYEYVNQNKIKKRCLICEAETSLPSQIKSFQIAKANHEVEVRENNKISYRLALFFKTLFGDFSFSFTGLIKGIATFIISNAIYYGIIYWIFTLFTSDEKANTYSWTTVPSIYLILVLLIIIFGWRETKSKESYYGIEPTLDTIVQDLSKKATNSQAHVYQFKESIRKQYIRESSNIEAIDAMNGIEFERHLQYFFETKGFTVKMTPASGDNGVDLLIRKNKTTTAVQCKRYSSSVGVSAVQEVFTGASFYNCKDALLITSSSFTTPAKNMAKKLGVILWDREELIKQLAQIQTKESWDEFLNRYYD